MRCSYFFKVGIAGYFLLLVSCNEKDKDEQEINAPIAVGELAPTPVKTAFASYTNFQYLIQSNGKLKSLKEQTIVSETDGEVMVCKAFDGSQVVKGGVILQMETTKVKFRLDRANLNEFNANKEYESQLLSYENLLKDKREEEGNAIRQKLKISSGLAGAQQDIKEATYDLSKSVIAAPFSGRLADVNVQLGKYLHSGQTLFRIYDPTSFLLETKILEADAPWVKTGMIAEVSTVSQSEIKFKASVYEINPYVDPDGMITIKLLIANAQGAPLFPGMNCTATIKVPVHRAVVIPKDALVMRNGKPVVFTMEDGKAKWNYVSIGKDNGKEVEITAGLRNKEKVITTANLQLGDDAPVVEDNTGKLLVNEN
jgi:membrane fusion protein (multidrug efflux system)